MKRLLLATLLLSGTAPAQEAARPSGIDPGAMDRAVKPGDDFERFANGAWYDRTEIPADRSSLGAFLTVQQLAEKRLAAVVADAAKAPAGSEARKIADYHRAWLDTAAIEARGLAPIQPELSAIADLRDTPALSRMLGANLRADVDPLNATDFQTGNLFGLFVSQAFDDPATTTPYLLQGGLGLPERDYYLSDDAKMQEIRTAYRAHLAQVFGLLGLADAEARADRVLALETRIARAHVDQVASNDAHKANNTWRRADFAAKAPGIDWTAFWQAAGLGGQDRFIVWQPSAVAGLSALVASAPMEAWQDWLRYHRTIEVASVLPKGFQDASFAFYGKTLTGTPAQRPRDKRALNATSNALGDAIGKIYVQRFFPASSKADIQQMVRGILAAFDARVAALDWMAPATKAEARRKIESMQVGIGYPERWRDYAALEVRADDPVGNLRRAELAEYRHQIGKIGKPVDRGEWWMTPQTVNAVNLPLQNALNFPAAILEAPFYDPKRDAAANYGAIGAVIGHEISHGFDNLGADFDAQGKLRNWWTPADLSRFDAQGKALVAQYDAYEALPGLHVKGELTLGENIADVAGLAAALQAYHASLGGRPAPVIDGMTGDQRLFLSFAQTWASKFREAALRGRVATDAHAPARFRAQTVRNLDGWYEAFGVRPDDSLYLPPDKRVKVW